MGWWAEIPGAGTGEPGLVVVDAWGWLDLSLSLRMALYMCSWREEEEPHLGSYTSAFSWSKSEMQRGGLKSTPNGRVTFSH